MDMKRFVYGFRILRRVPILSRNLVSVLEAKFRSGKLFGRFRFLVLFNAARRVRFPLVDSLPGRLVNSPIENKNEA